VRILGACICFCLVLAGCSTRSRSLREARQLEQTRKWSAALTAYQRLLPEFPAREMRDRAMVYSGMAHCLMKLGHPGEAQETLQRALALDPQSYDAHLRIAELYLSAGVAEGARDHVSFVLHAHPESAQGLALEGTLFALEGNAERAKKTLSRAVAADPTQEGVAEALAELYDRDNEVEAARAVLRRAAAAQPENVAPRLVLARLEEQEGNSPAAEAAYRDAVRVRDTAETNVRLAEFLARNSRIGEAEDVLARVDAMQPAAPVALPDFELNTGHTAEALRDYQSAFASQGKGLDPAQRAGLAARLVEADLQTGAGVEEAHLHLAQMRRWLAPGVEALLEAEISLAEGDLNAARLRAEDAVKTGDSAPARYLLGNIAYRLRATAEAQKHWREALDINPGYSPALIALASDALDRGHPEDAEAYILEVVRAEPANFDGLLVYARALLGQGRFDSAQTIVRRAQIAKPESPEPGVVLGELALKQKKLAEALIEFEKAVLLDRGAGSAYSGLTEVFRSGNMDRTVLHKMEETAARAPASPTLYEIAGRLYADHGWNEDALRCLRRAYEISALRSSAVGLEGGSAGTPSNGGAIHLLAASEAEHRNALHDAEREYLSALKGGDSSGIAANNLAWIYAQRDASLDRALSLARQAVAARPHDAAALDTLGYVHLRRREFSQALDSFARAQASLGHEAPAELTAELRVHIAEARRGAGQPEGPEALSNK
jgi:tetratricopeptide (TPR) repeat protein